MLQEKKTIIVSVGSGSLIFLILVFILGFFQYGQTLSGGLATVLLAIVFALFAIIGVVPILGLAFYAYFSLTWLMPQLINFTGTSESWLTTIIFIFGLLLACLLTLFSCSLLFFKS